MIGYKKLTRRFTLHLPVIKDEDEASKIQDFCEMLNLPASKDESLGPLEVRGTNNNGSELMESRRKRISSLKSNRKKQVSSQSADQVSRRRKTNSVSHSNGYRFSGRKKEPRVNGWNYQPEVIDLSVLEDVEKLALDYFSNALQAEGETLEKTMERIYGGEDADRCLEFTQVGNCGIFASQRVKVFQKPTLPDIMNSKNPADNDMRREEKRPKIHLPSIFEVSYSSPLTSRR